MKTGEQHLLIKRVSWQMWHSLISLLGSLVKARADFSHQIAEAVPEPSVCTARRKMARGSEHPDSPVSSPKPQ
jgi:hypothetical protein